MKKVMITLVALVIATPVTAKKITAPQYDRELASKKDGRGKSPNKKREIPSIAKTDGTNVKLSARDDAKRTAEQQQGLENLWNKVQSGDAAVTRQVIDDIHTGEVSEARSGKANYSVGK
jgi:hypothetical protein